jgi:P27 family predicted phage terminase small subunit
MVGSRGPLPKPTSIRSMKAGGLSRRSLADVPADEFGIATMPQWLSKEAKAFWRRNAPELDRRGLLTGLDENMFAVLCESWARLREMDRRIEQDGPVIVGPRGGVRVHPLTNARSRLQRSVMQDMQSFGMSPASRARIQVTPPRSVEEPDEFETFLNRSRYDPADDPRDLLKDD